MRVEGEGDILGEQGQDVEKVVESKAGSASTTKTKKSKGFPGLLNKVGKGKIQKDVEGSRVLRIPCCSRCVIQKDAKGSRMLCHSLLLCGVLYKRMLRAHACSAIPCCSVVCDNKRMVRARECSAIPCCSTVCDTKGW